jgi:hypothetical protein
MVEISLSGSGEGPGWVTAPGYSTAAFPASRLRSLVDRRSGVSASVGLAGPIETGDVLCVASTKCMSHMTSRVTRVLGG